MKMKRFTLLLAMVLCISRILPVTTWAAQEDPLVLSTKEDSSGEYRYFYDGEGRCLLEERVIGNIYQETYYSYGVNGALADKRVYVNDKISEETFYDDFGNTTEHWEYRGGNTFLWQSTPEYDEYGRLVWNTTVGPYDKNRNIADSYEVEKVRYEYYDNPVTLFFGHYEQDDNTANGAEPIEWEVLDTDGDNILLISKYALDSRVYHSKNIDVSWKDSDLRTWLNEEFLEKAFSYSEYYQTRDVLLETGVSDRVFLLSTAETLYYFPDDEDRICEATPYAVKRGAYVNNATEGSWWLLRTPGTASQCVASVNSDGTMDYDGGKVASKKGTVRPVMWVSNTAMKGNCTPARKHEWLDAYEDSATTPTYTMSRLLTYNDEGVLIYDQLEDKYTRGWSTSERNSYDDFGNPTEAIESIRYYGGEEDLHIYTYENTYDKAGRLTKQIQYWDGHQQELIQYRYDSKGNVTSKTKAYYAGDNWETYATKTWTHDRYGNLLTFSFNGQVEEEYTYTPLSEVSMGGD